LWRVTAGIAAVALGVIVLCAGPGSIEIVSRVPAGATSASLATPAAASAAGLPSWTSRCFGLVAEVDQAPLAFCARVEGRVIARYTKPDDRETHILVTGGWHVTLVELRPRARVPSLGSWVVAIGPLAAGAEWGFREMKAVKVTG
jgi:hypothetical protein